MRPFARSLPVAVVAIVVFAAVVTLKSQDNVPAQPKTKSQNNAPAQAKAKSQNNVPLQPERWEYAMVVGGFKGSIIGDAYHPGASGTAYICFASTAGCRYENVHVANEMPQDVANSVAKTYNQALASAAARLGLEGWELTNTVGSAGTDAGVVHMYFRRPVK